MKFIFASIPRSGHHVIMNIIQDYAKSCDLVFSYCEFYSHLKATHPPHHCTNYPDCNSSLIVKTHDFELNPKCDIVEWREKIEIKEDHKYFVLYRRDEVRQFEAWYRHFKQNNNKDKHDYSDFINFVQTNVEYYQAFKKKWVGTSHENVIAFTYEDFIQKPVSILKQMINVIYSDHKCNMVKLKAIINKHDVSWKNTISVEVYEKLKQCVQIV